MRPTPRGPGPGPGPGAARGAGRVSRGARVAARPGAPRASRTVEGGAGRPPGSPPSGPGRRPAEGVLRSRAPPAGGPYRPLTHRGENRAVTQTVLLAEDDRAIRDSLVRLLTLEGYEVTGVADGIQALAAVHNSQPDVLVLDVMMPGIDGLAVCRVLRAENDRTPILMLTARVETSDRVAGLDAGADDYMVKPFEAEELLARLRALLRRAAAVPEPAGAEGSGGEGRGGGVSVPSGVITVADLRVDPTARRVWRGETEVQLSRTEYDLLELLARNAGIVLDHSTVYDRIWGYDFGPGSKNLAVYIGYLRRKLELPGTPQLIHTVRGVGYTLREP